MVQPKYNPQEALERVKLMMNYDLSKTSTENKKVIEEQTQPNSDPFSCIINYYKSRNVQKYFIRIGTKAVGMYTLTQNSIGTFRIFRKSREKWLVLKWQMGSILNQSGEGFIWNCTAEGFQISK
jgi:hypothetical protein